MKAPTTAAKPALAAARNAALMNLLASPGLGSLMARRWLVGSLQLAIFLTGFVLFLRWFLQDLHAMSALLRGDDAPSNAPDRGLWWISWSLVLVSWIWAAITSRDIWQTAKAANQMTPPMLPPKLATVPSPVRGWDLAGQTISRTFDFNDFAEALEFVNAVGERAEEVQHHPDIDIRWNKVTLALTSHDVGRLTERDIDLAGDCNELFEGKAGI